MQPKQHLFSPRWRLASIAVLAGTIIVPCAADAADTAPALVATPMNLQPAPALPADLRQGLVLHLDASNFSSIVRDDNGRVVGWKDLSPAGKTVTLGSQSGPRYVVNGIGGRPTLRFEGDQFFRVEELAAGAGEVSIFAVFRRNADQASERRWQRVVSGWNGLTENDNAAPNFLLDTKGDGKTMTPTILSAQTPRGTYRGAIEIGRNAAKKDELLQGDLAELLIYDRSFLVYEPIQQINDYFIKKWGIVVDNETNWTRSGPLPTLPTRVTDAVPLSDQQNEAKWTKFAPLSDEFNRAGLDEAKWWDHNPNWYGRAPSRYLARNVSVQNGEMGITMSYDESLPKAVLYPNGSLYENYGAASVVGKTPVRYGYFEIRAQAMPSVASSAFWLAGNSIDKAGREHKIEIDVFELGATSEKHTNKYGMNAHVFKHPQTGEEHVSRGGTWTTPFLVGDDYHVYGLEWAPDFIRYYVDGVLVRSLQNDLWHAPMNLIFDTETMGNWLGIPDPKELPATFKVDYLRVWKNPKTDSDWSKEFTLPRDPATPTDISKYVRSLEGK